MTATEGDGAVMEEQQQEQLLNAEQVRELLDMRSTQTILRWVKSGKLPAVILGPKTIRFRMSDIEAFIGEHATSA